MQYKTSKSVKQNSEFIPQLTSIILVTCVRALNHCSVCPRVEQMHLHFQSAMMRLGLAGSHLFNWFVIILLSSGFLSMVLCGALVCSWERATDTRGLSRHRTSCHFYKRSSVLATQKRQERAKEAVSTNLAANLPQSMFLHVSDGTSCRRCP